MTNLLLYAAVVAIWGSSWIGVRFQLGVVDPEVSIAYRFLISAAAMWLFCLIARRRMRFTAVQHFWMVVQGVCLFCTNYVFLYHGTFYIATGLVSVVFSTLTLYNMVNAAIFFGSPFQSRVVIGAAVGLGGIGLVFAPELSAFDFTSGSLRGLALCLIATLCASFGMMASLRNLRSGVPVIEANTWAMGYGGIAVSLIALAEGKPFTFDPSPAYVISLLWLALIATVIGFACYLNLQGRIGPARAGYSSVLFPIIALAISTVVENYHWSALAAVGVALVLWGNVLILAPPGFAANWLRRLGVTS